MSTRYEVGFNEGTVCVVVRPAECLPTGHRRTGYALGNPGVELTTDPADAAPGEHGWLTIRGRRYRIRSYHRRELDRDGWVNLDGEPIRWSAVHYGGPTLFNDNGDEVGWNTKARERLRDIEAQALDYIDEHHPQWRRESFRDALTGERARQLDKCDDLRDQLAEYEADIARLSAELASY